MTAPVPGPPRPPLPPAGGPLPAPADPAVVVARAMAALDGLTDRPLAAHVAAFERVHAALGEALAAGEA